jgi:acyl-coenzyme A thioesterase 13
MNSRLAFIQDRIGREVTDSRSEISNWLRMTPVSAEKGKIVVTIPVRSDMTNIMKTIHGGMIATILDDLCGTVCLISADDFFYATINLHVDYLNPASVGDVLKATAEVVRQGKTIINVQAVLERADGKIVARASSNLINTQIPATNNAGIN